MFKVFAGLIALQLETRGRQQAAEIALGNERATAELREQFIAVLGHDLRNPLSTVRGTAEILARRREPELAKTGARLKATTQRMARLIDDVMDFARGRLGSGIGISVAPTGDLTASSLDVVSELREGNPLVRSWIAFPSTGRCIAIGHDFSNCFQISWEIR
jgi:signal transduction histidine kinase